jgi:hypothetical protein
MAAPTTPTGSPLPTLDGRGAACPPPDDESPIRPGPSTLSSNNAREMQAKNAISTGFDGDDSGFIISVLDGIRPSTWPPRDRFRSGTWGCGIWQTRVKCPVLSAWGESLEEGGPRGMFASQPILLERSRPAAPSF